MIRKSIFATLTLAVVFFSMVARAQVTFSKAAYPLQFAPSEVGTGDLNRDGRPDLAVFSAATGNMKLWLDHTASTVQSNTNIFDQQISLSAGPHIITVQALDSSNGLIYADTVNITVSTGSHTVTITSPSDGATVGSPVNVHATYSASATASYMAR